MEFIYVLGICIIIGLMHQTDAVEYKLISNGHTWHDADKDCRSRDGFLVDLDSHDKVIQFQKSITLPPGQVVWTSAFRKHSPWVWIEGCFSASFLSKDDGIRLPKNKASECSSLCKDAAYAALKGSMCFCLDDMRELLPLDANSCNVECPGAPGEKCGGKGVVSLYSLGGVNGYKESDNGEAPKLSIHGRTIKIKSKTKSTIHDESRADWKNCVYILKHDTAIWITADCRKPLAFLCKIYREDGAIIEYRSPKRKYGTWTEARDMCRTEGGTLADLHANNMEAVSALPKHSEYWVGLYRNTSWVWHRDNQNERPTWCTSMTEDDVGDLHFQTESCTMPHNYVCQIGIMAVSSAQTGNLAVFVTCGTIAWILAIVTAIIIIYVMKKRGCRRRATADDGTTQIHSNYFDLDEERSSSSTATPSRQHSYVNSQAGNQSSCSQPPACSESQLKPGSSACMDSSRYYTSNGNEYATVMPTRGNPDASEQYDDLEHARGFGACGSERSSTSTEGDYDHVWDSLRLGEKLQAEIEKSRNKSSSSSEHIYQEVAKPTRVHLPLKKENDYVTTPNLFPAIDEFGRERTFEKSSLSRTRSKSL